jgi:hypothetical protein
MYRKSALLSQQKDHVFTVGSDMCISVNSSPSSNNPSHRDINSRRITRRITQQVNISSAQLLRHSQSRHTPVVLINKISSDSFRVVVLQSRAMEMTLDRSGLTFIFVWKSGAASILAVICVRTKPGEMLLTRMPWGAHSIARVWVMLRRAALVPPLLSENVSEWTFLMRSICLGPFGDVGRDYSSRIGRHGEDGRTYCELVC